MFVVVNLEFGSTESSFIEISYGWLFVTGSMGLFLIVNSTLCAWWVTARQGVVAVKVVNTMSAAVYFLISIFFPTSVYLHISVERPLNNGRICDDNACAAVGMWAAIAAVPCT